jgi:uncharacterized alkaline shock family protein YloU
MVEETETSMAQVEQLQVIEVGGETDINDEVIGAIAGIACREIEGVSSLGTSSIRRSISERLGSAEQRARGVAVRQRRAEGQRRSR